MCDKRYSNYLKKSILTHFWYTENDKLVIYARILSAAISDRSINEDGVKGKLDL